MAVPAITGTPLADGLERIAIIPANYGVDDLVSTLNAFDTTILMKIGSEMPKVVAALERTGLTEKAVYVAKATMREQDILFVAKLSNASAWKKLPEEVSKWILSASSRGAF